ncbi:MAG: HD domain-containing protein [Planctomycetota bacterium]
MSTRRFFVVRDAVHGDIHLTREEGRLLDTREMQRLRGVAQLGLAHLVFPGARHSRFEHSIGTLHMTSRLVAAINRNAELWGYTCRRVSPEEERLMRAAALVHDVTHIPFGHNVEDQCGLLPRHDRPERFRAMLARDGELGAELEAQGLLEPVLDVLGAGGPVPAPFLAQVISDTICSDLMDYLLRDAHYTGLDLRYDARIADWFKVDSESGACSSTARRRASSARTSCPRSCACCRRATGSRSGSTTTTPRSRPGRWSPAPWRTPCSAAGSPRGPVRPDRREPPPAARARGGGPDDAAARDAWRMLDGLRRRRLLKRVAVLPYEDNRALQDELVERFFSPARAGHRRELEAGLERDLEARFGRRECVQLYCPSRRMQLKEVGTLVRMPGADDLAPLSTFRDRIPRIADLEDSYLRLWRVYVLTTASAPEERRLLQERVREALPGAVDAYRIR